MTAAAPKPRHSPTGGSASLVAPALGVCILCFALYGGFLGNPFLIDDPPAIVSNPRVTGGQWGALLTEPYWQAESTDRLYRPLVSLSFGLNWAISQSPWTFRLPNLLLHMASCVLVLILARDVFRNRVAGVIAAVLFAIHPVHTEPCLEIVGRADLAAFAAMLGAAILWWRDAETGLAGRRRPLAASLLFAAAVFCKESALTLVGVVLVLDIYRERSRAEGAAPLDRAKRLARCYAPMLVVAVVYLGLRYAVLDQLTSSERILRVLNPINTPADALGEGDSAVLVRFGTPLATWGKACTLLFAPWPLSHDYSYDAIAEVRRVGDPRLWIGAAWLVAVAVAGILSWRRRGMVWVALALGIVQYAIVSNAVVVIGTIFGERLLYAPSVGFCLAIGLLLAGPVERLAEAWRARRSPGAVSVVWGGMLLAACLAGGALTIVRGGHWSSDTRLLASISPEDPVSYKILCSYALLAAGEAAVSPDAAAHIERGRQFAERAIRKAPEMPVPYQRLAELEFLLGNYDRVIELQLEALRRGAGTSPQSPEHLRTLEYLGQAYKSAGRYAQAIDVQSRLVSLSPGYARGRSNLAEMLLAAPPPHRDAPRALREAEKAVALSPAPDGWVYVMQVQALDAMGQRGDAVAAAEGALRAIHASDPFRATLADMLRRMQAP